MDKFHWLWTKAVSYGYQVPIKYPDRYNYYSNTHTYINIIILCTRNIAIMISLHVEWELN